jgi:hypothetical protein
VSTGISDFGGLSNGLEYPMILKDFSKKGGSFRLKVVILVKDPEILVIILRLSGCDFHPPVLSFRRMMSPGLAYMLTGISDFGGEARPGISYGRFDFQKESAFRPSKIDIIVKDSPFLRCLLEG